MKRRPGPIPKRSEEVMGHRTRAEMAERAPEAEGAADVIMPPADPDWHRIASDWYLSLGESGQSQFYEPSDWATARLAAEVMSRTLLSESRITGPLFTAMMSAACEMLSTEASRRRLRMELAKPQHQQATPPGVTAINSYRDRLGG